MPLSSLLKICAMHLVTENLYSYLNTLFPKCCKTLGLATGNLGYLCLRKYFKIYSLSIDHLRLS
jgi:hypothetical protein